MGNFNPQLRAIELLEQQHRVSYECADQSSQSQAGMLRNKQQTT